MNQGVPRQAGVSRIKQNSVVWAWVLLSLHWGAIFLQSQDSDPESRLRSRISLFWTAMQKEDYSAASQLVHPNSRDYFAYKMPRSRVGVFNIQKLDFNQDKTACSTVTSVRKSMPMFGTEVDWPMRHKWIVSQGEWFLDLSDVNAETNIASMFRGERETQAQIQALQGKPVAKAEAAGRVKSVAPDPDSLLGLASRLEPDPSNPKAIHFGQKGIFRFHYRNEGKEPFRILSAYADCHCTSLSRDFPEITPGQSGIFEVGLDTFGLPLGDIAKDVFVQFSDMSSPITIRINVSNLPNFILDPPILDFGQIALGSTVEKSFRLSNQSWRTVKFFSSPDVDPKFQLSLEKASLEPDESMTVTLRFKADTLGEILGSIMLRCDLPTEPLLNARITGMVGP